MPPTKITLPTLVVMGIDSGLAGTGVAIIAKEMGKFPWVRYAGYVKTPMPAKKSRKGIRVAAMDLDRYTKVFQFWEDIFEEYHPYALGTEVYSYQPGRVTGLKTMAIYGGSIFWALSHGINVSVFLPMDLKSRFCGKKNASKKAVETGVCQAVDGLGGFLDEYPPGVHEHMADATGHAILAMEAVNAAKASFGLEV